jgi:chromosomal replication initiator protein
MELSSNHSIESIDS